MWGQASGPVRTGPEAYPHLGATACRPPPASTLGKSAPGRGAERPAEAEEVAARAPIKRIKPAVGCPSGGLVGIRGAAPDAPALLAVVHFQVGQPDLAVLHRGAV